MSVQGGAVESTTDICRVRPEVNRDLIFDEKQNLHGPMTRLNSQSKQ